MQILLAGSIAFDYLMRFPGRFKDVLLEQSLDKISLSFLVEDMHRHFGGVSANIAYSMALLGDRPRLFGTVGKDFSEYRAALDAAGVDTSTVVVLPEVFTGSFFVNTDQENNQIATFYGGAMSLAGGYRIWDTIKDNPDLVVISPNAPDAMQNQVEDCQARSVKYFYDPSQQVARLSGDSLRQGIEGCWAVACNEYEWEVIQKHTGYTLDGLLNEGHIFVHTLGADGSNIYADGQVHHIPAFPPERIVDPTGAGDAYRAGLLRGISLGLPWNISGRLGALCSAYSLEFIGTQNHYFTHAAFVERFRTQFDDSGALDILLSE
jgi:adenosine kinase